MLRLKIIIHYIFYCIKHGAYPWRFFQINAEAFNREKKIFSKYDMESHFPEKWKLKSYFLKKQKSVRAWKQEIESQFSFPLFIKPEWGQNSHGIFRVDTKKQLSEVLKIIAKEETQYYCQELAAAEKEFDILYLRSPYNKKNISILSVTELIDTHQERYPIHGIHNGTAYKDISSTFSQKEYKILKEYFQSVGNFNMARVAVKATSKESVIAGDFKIIEINIFLPMPINLFDNEVSGEEKYAFVKHFSQQLAEITKHLDIQKSAPTIWKSIMWNMTKKHLKIRKVWNT